MKLTIEKVVSQGEGLAREGKDVYFTTAVLPGEVVEVKELSRKGHIVSCELVEVLTPSPQRIEPLCPYYGTCGGCNLQIASPEEGLRLKQEIVLENLKRIGKIDASTCTIKPPLVSAPTAYRQRVRFQVDLNLNRVGFFARRSHEVVDIRRCPVLVAPLEALLGEKRELLLDEARRRKGRNGIVTVAALAGTDGSISLDKSPVAIEAGGKKLHASAGVFFQNNIGILEQMIPLIETYGRGKGVVDLFSGVGTFASFVEGPDVQVTAVERDASCLALARKNLKFTRFYTEQVEIWSERQRDFPVDSVIVDPPRSGLSPVARHAISSMNPERILYVSCDSATFSRDAAHLSKSGYILEELTVADMYPQTYHTETIAYFTKTS